MAEVIQTNINKSGNENLIYQWEFFKLKSLYLKLLNEKPYRMCRGISSRDGSERYKEYFVSVHM